MTIQRHFQAPPGGRRRVLAGLLALAAAPFASAEERFSFFLGTPETAVMQMLKLAGVGSDDLVLDLGSGDGRIPIFAARHFGARGWGVDLNPRLVAESIENARKAGVTDRVRFETRDVLRTDTAPATVVTIYLLPGLVDQLRDKLLRELQPGSRIVMHDFTFAAWAPDRTLRFHAPEKFEGRGGESTVSVWIVPADVFGVWRLDWSGAAAEIVLRQQFQVLEGEVLIGRDRFDLIEPRIEGNRLSFGADLPVAGRRERHRFEGRVHGGEASGSVRRDSAVAFDWRAVRVRVR